MSPSSAILSALPASLSSRQWSSVYSFSAALSFTGFGSNCALSISILIVFELDVRTFKRSFIVFAHAYARYRAGLVFRLRLNARA